MTRDEAIAEAVKVLSPEGTGGFTNEMKQIQALRGIGWALVALAQALAADGPRAV